MIRGRQARGEGGTGGQNLRDPIALKNIDYNIWGEGPCQCFASGPPRGPGRGLLTILIFLKVPIVQV